MEEKKRYYTIIEAARLLGISRSSIYEAIREGRLKARPRRVFKTVLCIDASSLHSYNVSLSHQERGKKTRPKSRPLKK